MQMFSVDEVYDIIGHFGRTQFFYFIQLALITVLIAQHMLLNIYIGLEPSFKCHFSSHESKAVVWKDKCPNNTASLCKFDFEESHSTIISEWNLVCDQKYKAALVQSIWMGGVLTGSLLLSSLADRFGRIKALTFAIMGVTFFDGMAAFAASYLTLVLFRFLAGMCCALLIVVSFVLSQELIGLKWRSTCSMLLGAFFACGIAVLSVIAAYVTYWRVLTFIVSISGCVFLIIPCLIPESPRWLVGKRLLDEAKEVLQGIATKDGKSHLLPLRWSVGGAEGNSPPQNTGFVASICSHSYLITISLILLFSWFVNSGVYYTLTMSAARSTHGSVYWATSLNGLIEVPASLCSIFLIERFGRKSTICSFMLGCGFVCLIIPLVPVSFDNTLALMGKLAISASFNIIYLHSGEIFPTMIRNTAIGMLSMSARVGGIVSPFVMMLGDVYPNLHFVFLGSLAFTAGILNLKLPETLGMPLPETIDDVIALGRCEGKVEASWFSGIKGYKKLQQDAEEVDIEDNTAEESEKR